MKKILFTGFILFYSNSFCQNYSMPDGYYFSSNESPIYNSTDRAQFAEKGIKEVESFGINSKGDTVLVDVMQYDKEGRIIFTKVKHWRFDKRFKISTYAYSDNDKVREIHISDYKENPQNTMYFEYDSLGQVIRFENHSAKKGFTNGIVNKYEGTLLIDTKHFYDSKDDVKFEWVYDYYDDSSRKETNYYHKGKLKYTWHYECDPAGKQAKALHKDTSTICIKRETDDLGNTVVYKRQTDDDGKLVLNKIVYDQNNLKSIKEFLSTDVKGDTIKYSRKDVDATLYVEYKKGTKRYEIRTTYNEDGRKVQHTYNNYRHPRWSGREQFIYSDDGILILKKHFDHKGRLDKETKYEIKYF